MRVSGWTVVLSMVMGCAASDPPAHGGETERTETPASAAEQNQTSEPTPFAPDFHDAGADAQPAEPPVNLAFDIRLKTQIHGVTGADFVLHDWEGLLRAEVPYSGVKIWMPGTGTATVDVPGKRSMHSAPAALASLGPVVTFSSTAPAPSNAWIGVACSQAVGGARYAALGKLSALEVFETAWPDAKAMVAALGPSLKGAWIVAHSAGANPAILAGLLGGAHRIDVYGVPSAVGALDGDDGLVHAHTHPLDPAGSMGKLGTDGDAKMDLFGAFATAIKAGVSISHHDYSSWPAPSP